MRRGTTVLSLLALVFQVALSAQAGEEVASCYGEAVAPPSTEIGPYPGYPGAGVASRQICYRYIESIPATSVLRLAPNANFTGQLKATIGNGSRVDASVEGHFLHGVLVAGDLSQTFVAPVEDRPTELRVYAGAHAGASAGQPFNCGRAPPYCSPTRLIYIYSGSLGALGRAGAYLESGA